MLLSDQHCDIDGEVELNKDEEFTVTSIPWVLNEIGTKRLLLEHLTISSKLVCNAIRHFVLCYLNEVTFKVSITGHRGFKENEKGD